MKKCFFCGEDNPLVLEEHHIIPRSIEDSVETITLCANCHRKLHHLLRPLTKYVKLELVTKPKIPETKEQKRLREILEREKKLKMIILSLIVEADFLPKQRIYEVIEDYSKEEIDSALRSLIEEGTIYEPRDGYYKMV